MSIGEGNWTNFNHKGCTTCTLNLFRASLQGCSVTGLLYVSHSLKSCSLSWDHHTFWKKLEFPWLKAGHFHCITQVYKINKISHCRWFCKWVHTIYHSFHIDLQKSKIFYCKISLSLENLNCTTTEITGTHLKSTWGSLYFVTYYFFYL